MSKKGKTTSGTWGKYPYALKRQVAREYLQGGITLRELSEKYDIPNQTIHEFVNWYKAGEGQEEPPPASKIKAEEENDTEALRRKIKELEKLLEHEQMRSLGYETMIDIAEKELEIDIQKKSDTKQSKP